MGTLVLSNRASKLSLSCKANKCTDAGTGDLGVRTSTHETSSMNNDYTTWLVRLVIAVQPAQGECRQIRPTSQVAEANNETVIYRHIDHL